MSKLVHIESADQFSSLISSSSIVVADFYADWCGPCKQIAPVYEQLALQLTRPNKLTFTKINVDKQPELARAYMVTAMPTFMVFKNGRPVETIRGAQPKALSEVVKKLANEANAVGDGTVAGGFTETSTSNNTWTGAELPKGYHNITDQVDLQGLELLNRDSEFAGVRALFESGKPKSHGGSKIEGDPDWVESDTDEQLMLYIPLQSTTKVHSIYLTSFAKFEDDDEGPTRPKVVKIYTNRSHILGFDDADDIPATQEVTLSKGDWDPKTGTAKIELRFVKFQNVSSLVIFVVEGESGSEKCRLDRVRIIGESGEKRDPGKLEKIGEEDA